jgi:hypothetical protein
MSEEDDIQARVAETRANLQNTLDAIEDKFNVPKRVGELTDRARDSYERNPIPWLVGAVAVTGAVIGLVAWALSSDDD